MPISSQVTGSPPFWGEIFQPRLFSWCWPFSSPALEPVLRAPPAVEYSSGTCCGLVLCPAVSEDRSQGTIPFAIWPLDCLPGSCESFPLNAGIPKWLGMWPNSKTGRFSNSFLSPLQLGSKNWGFKMPFKYQDKILCKIPRLLLIYRNRQKKCKPSRKKIVKYYWMTIKKTFMDRMAHYHVRCNSNTLPGSLSLDTHSTDPVSPASFSSLCPLLSLTNSNLFQVLLISLLNLWNRLLTAAPFQNIFPQLQLSLAFWNARLTLKKETEEDTDMEAYATFKDWKN